MIWIAVGVILALIGAFAYFFWRLRKRRQTRLISFVALLREPVRIRSGGSGEPRGKGRDADLGDGLSEGPDGFVVGVGFMNTVMHAGRMFLINNLPKPYTEDIEKTAQGIKDLRIRALFREHQAWFSCDALGVDGATPEEECLEWYRRLGKLFAELLDDNCLLIFLPDGGIGVSDQRGNGECSGGRPGPALRATLTLPIVEVSDDDPRMKRAVEKARAEWPKFVAAYEERAARTFR